jgi:galactose oxidase-like protein
MPAIPLNELNQRLSMLWFYKTYTNVPVQPWQNWQMQPYGPPSFILPPPPEYIAPYPDPDYWPIGTATAPFPSWLTFWNSAVPVFPVVYPPVQPYFPVLNPGLNTAFEELCCIGYNPERGELEAVITIKLESGYGGGLCSEGTFEYVGFWLIEQSLTQNPPQPLSPNWGIDPATNYPGRFRKYIGTAKVNVFDIVREINATETPEQGYLRYTVKLPITPEMSEFILGCADSGPGSRLPRMHAVLAWQQDVTDANYNGQGIYWGDVMESDIQFTKKSYDRGSVQFRPRKYNEPQSFPVHGVLMKTGKILMMGGSSNIVYRINDKIDCDEIREVIEKSIAIYDPKTDTLIQGPTPPESGMEDINHKIEYEYECDGQINHVEEDHFHFFGHVKFTDVFCSGHSNLADVKVLVVSGTEFYANEGGHGPHEHHFPGLKTTLLYDPDKNEWEKVENLRDGRWYPTTQILGNGKIVAFSGHTSSLDYSLISYDGVDSIRHENTDTDIYDPETKNWINTFNDMMSVSEDPISKPDYYPRSFLMPNGTIFFATLIGTLPNPPAPTRDVVDKNYSWDPNSTTTPWIEINNSFNSKGVDISETAVMLPLLPPYNNDDIAVMIIKGADSFTIKPLSSNKLWVNSGRAVAKKRINGNSVLLPTGNIMVLGGVEDISPNLDSKGVRQTEIYDLRSNSWSRGADIYNTRNYHSGALLMPDARVLIYGSNFNGGQGSISNPNQDLSFEIYSPDYLFRGPRPEYMLDKVEFEYGSKVKMKLKGDWKLKNIRRDRIGLIKLGSVTHSFNFDQRYVGLKIEGDVDIPYVQPSPINLFLSEFNLEIPSNENLLPPGYYMLFIISALSDIQGLPGFPRLGVPSEAQIIQIKKKCEC